jgi:TonB-dependent starch-binding outer membrane protein SusC
MKKNRLLLQNNSYCSLKKLLLIMKLTTFLLLICIATFASNGYSQAEKVSIKLKDASIKELFLSVEIQTSYKFLFRNDAVENIQVTMDELDTPLDNILNEALKGSGLAYKILPNNLIVVASNDFLQQLKIAGTVTDENDNPLAGVTITVKGMSLGTISDSNGKYALEVTNSDAKLEFSFVGYLNQTVAVNGQAVINMKMVPDLQRLGEVVVIGYTSAKKKNVASSMSVLNSDAIVGLATTDVNQALQGKIAGVQVVNNGGDPGAGAKIIIRGMGSFTNVNPLYVVDGIAGGDINSVPVNDIQNITVLKDASTTAIYGSAAANGVVIVTTKSGKSGGLKVNYEGSVGVAEVTKRMSMMNATQYVDVVADIQKNNGLVLSDKLLTPDVRITRTDWQSEIFRRAMTTQHSLSFGGGSENVTYLFSAGYQNEKSTIIASDFERFTFGVKLSEQLLKKRLRFNENIRIKNDIYNGGTANFNDALRMPPYLEVYDPTNLGGYSRSDKVTDLTDANNPLASVYLSPYNSRSLGTELDLSGELDILRGLTFKSQARLSGGNYHDKTFNYPLNGGNFSRPTSNMVENYNFYYNMLFENFFSFEKTFGIHDISATAGNSYNPAGLYSSVQLLGSDFTSDDIQNVALANSNSISGSSLNSGKSRLSYFGRLGYTLSERYVLNVSVRRDGSSVFGANNRWGTFYGLGLAWTISKESFLSSIPEISNLKLRGSYGKTGNDNIPPNLTSSTVWTGSSNNIVYSFGDNGTFSNGATINSIPNPNLKWEETTIYDMGFDLGLFNNKITFVFDYYNRANKDLLINTQLPLTTGLGNPGAVGTEWINAASMKNSGFEGTITYTGRESEFKWDATVNATYSTNKVTALGTFGNTPISAGEFMAGIGNSTRTDIGYPIASYYGYKVDHVAVDQADVDKLNAAATDASSGKVTQYQVGLKPGDRVFKDIDGNGYVDAKDRTYIGNPTPKLQYGFIFNASYKNFDFQVMLQGVAGVNVVNAGKYWYEGMSKPFNQNTAVLSRWENPGDITNIPAAGQNSGSNLVFSDWYVEKGDYLRVKNLSLGYTLPQSLLNNAGAKLRIYVAIQNLITITKYSGYDPEISSISPNDPGAYIFQHGIDQDQHPNPRIYRVGIQLNF